ncbi:hypothetical protein O9K51_06108 [Purpureocillium lavendulum]|uniref:Uncharacterized protein n=1 Tax=Purpureocillium lavendulum TaxID=1247861 RepID=A0AB34FMD8_9HYPO|nr:hypothetical protein O9K51_06108 [Purpureocillium lavendulum]
MSTAAVLSATTEVARAPSRRRRPGGSGLGGGHSDIVVLRAQANPDTCNAKAHETHCRVQNGSQCRFRTEVRAVRRGWS